MDEKEYEERNERSIELSAILSAKLGKDWNLVAELIELEHLLEKECNK